MNFKKFRIERNLTQAQAGKLIGMSKLYWAQLETGKEHPAKIKAFVRILDKLEHPDIDKPLTPDRMQSVRQYGLKFVQASEQIGASENVWSNILNGHVQHKTRWVRLVNALLIELAEGKKPELDTTPSSDVEVVQATVLTSEPKSEQDVEISDQGLIPFAYGKRHVRCKMVNDSSFWMLTDVCRAIGYKWFDKAPALIRERDQKTFRVIDSLGREQDARFISEAGLYQFLTRARVPSVEPFQDWLFDEVLPTLRKTGAYQIHSPAPVDPISQVALIGQALQTLAEQMQLQKAELENQALKVALLEQKQKEERASAEQVANSAILKIQGLNTKKVFLRKLVHAIVDQANRLDGEIMADPFRDYGAVWRAVHGAAQPPVNKIDNYTTPAQINTAIEAAKGLLTRLGGALPAEQLEMEGVA